MSQDKTDLLEQKEEDMEQIDSFYGKEVVGKDGSIGYEGGAIGAGESYFSNLKSQVETDKTNAETQQEEIHGNTIDDIESQRDDAEDEYDKEQSAAYTDWQKQSAQHGVNAERMASMGMTGTGYSESSQVAMYNQYQSRVATAKAAMERANAMYDSMISQAEIQNSATLAQIAAAANQQLLEITLQAFQYKNNLIAERYNAIKELETYYSQQEQQQALLELLQGEPEGENHSPYVGPYGPLPQQNKAVSEQTILGLSTEAARNEKIQEKKRQKEISDAIWTIKNKYTPTSDSFLEPYMIQQ